MAGDVKKYELADKAGTLPRPRTRRQSSAQLHVFTNNDDHHDHFFRPHNPLSTRTSQGVTARGLAFSVVALSL